MKTYSKKIIGLLVSLAAVLCCAFTFLMAKPKVAHAENNATFASVPGASVYIKTFEGFEDLDTNGIRFSFEIDQNTYESLVEEVDGVKVWKSGVSVMAYIVPEDNLADGYTADDVMADTDTNSKPITADKWRLTDSEITTGTKVYTSYAYLYNLPPVAYDSTIVSCAKLTTTEGTMVTDVQTRSMRQVAQNALNANAYAYGTDGYKGCLKYCETYTLTLGDTEYTAAYGVKLNGLPTLEDKAGVSGKWTVNGEEITSSTVWNTKNNATAVALYDATSTVKEIALCKYSYANDLANVKTMTDIVSAYELGEVSAVYYADNLTANLLDANGKVNVTDLANGQKQMIIVADGTNFIVNTLVADGVLTNENQAKFSTIIDANLAGYYVLDGDITFTTRIKTIGKVNNTTYNQFTGTFDGRGYAMTNLTMGADGGEWYSGTTSCSRSIFAVNKGTIKNLYVEFYGTTLTYDYAFVGEGRGTFLNVYAQLTLQSIPTNPSAGYGTSALINKLYSGATVKNCIGEVKLDSAKIADTTQDIYIGTLVGRSYSGTGVTVADCYGILNGYSYKSSNHSKKATNDGLVLDYTNASFDYTGKMAALNTRANLLDKTFAESDGWLYWHKEADGLYFGTTKIVANS